MKKLNLGYTDVWRKDRHGQNENYDIKNTVCHFEIGSGLSERKNSKHCFTISFTLATEQRGADYLVEIGEKDLPSILSEIVNNMPESYPAFLECAKIIAKKNSESLTAFLECATIANNAKMAQENQM